MDESEVTQGKIGNCSVCEKDHHDIEDCPILLAQYVQDRGKIIFNKKTLLWVSSRNFKGSQCQKVI